jgi:hypothetical protein
MPYSIPSPTNATYVARPTGRSDAVHDEVASKIQQPKFVDNAVHHVRYEASSVGDVNDRTSVMKKPLPGDFAMTHERRYTYAEEESALRLSHVDRDTQPYYNGALMTPTSTLPPLLLDAEDAGNKLAPERIVNTEYGSRLILKNMRGKTLKDFKMGQTTHFRLAHMISVGLRTTDLVERLFTNSLHGLNSVSIGLPVSASNNNASRLRHSRTFLAKDFYDTAIPAAIRAVARHDHYSLFHDRFGNFIYAPKMFKVIDREIGQKRGAGSVSSDPITESANRIMLQGKPQALNDEISIIVDDAEAQKKEGVIRQMRVRDATATNITKGRRSANQFLRLNRKAQGAIKTDQHARSWDLEPGEVVDFKAPSSDVNTKKAIIELTHESIGESAFQLASYESGLEGVINAFADDADADSEDKAPDRSNQIQVIEKSGVGRAQFKTIGAVSTRTVSATTARIKTDATITHANLAPNVHSGFLIGHRHADMTGASRGAIGSGFSKRLQGDLTAPTTITVSTITDGFPSAGHLTLTYISGATYSVATVAYTGKTATTFTGVSIVAPSGGTIPANISEIKLLRPRAHEMRAVKTLKKTRRL